MAVTRKKSIKGNPIYRFVEFLLAIIFAIYIVPEVKNTFFPDDMTRLEKMLRRSVMDGYQLAVDRRSNSKIVLTVYNGGESIVTEIYGDVVIEPNPAGDGVMVFAHSINDNSDDVVYLTRTRIEADSDLKSVRRLEVTVCDRIADQTGRLQYDGHEPVYECAVPIQKIVCKGVVSEH